MSVCLHLCVCALTSTQVLNDAATEQALALAAEDAAAAAAAAAAGDDDDGDGDDDDDDDDYDYDGAAGAAAAAAAAPASKKKASAAARPNKPRPVIACFFGEAHSVLRALLNTKTGACPRLPIRPPARLTTPVSSSCRRSPDGRGQRGFLVQK